MTTGRSSRKRKPTTPRTPAIILDKRSPGRASLRIGLVAWSGERALSYFSAAEFLRAIEIVSPHISRAVDLIVCAGRRVYCNRSEHELPAAGLVRATDGAPILFEWYAEASGGREVGEWRLARQGRRATIEVVRRRQVVRRSTEPAQRFAGLARLVAASSGVLGFEGIDARVVLMICGEINALDVKNRRSVLRHAEGCHGLANALGRSWVVVNPWHAPCWPRIARTGAAKMFEIAGRPPLLSRVVTEVGDGVAFEDGAVMPAAVVHCNTFLPALGRERHPTAHVATLAFSRANRGKAIGPVVRVDSPRGSSAGIIDWRYDEVVVDIMP